MSDTLNSKDVCTRLGVDVWGLKRLIEIGDLVPLSDAEEPSFARAAVMDLCEQRRRRRGEALAEMAAMDGPFMGLGQ